MKNKNIILLVTLLISLISCSGLKEGIVEEKHILPARTFYASGVYNQVSERYRIKIRSVNNKGKLKSRNVFLTKASFDSLEIGDTYVIKYPERK